jgi:hypothetical protein
MNEGIKNIRVVFGGDLEMKKIGFPFLDRKK